ncbi:hypothetical protein [Eubacterium limosum]|uniref:hypothetical protein n=1 Tax=Eubacterium limosum TaxID=1736 RepID=UPI00106361AB|nr:hypothetical protein [Eubacterium limosum]
MKRSILAFRGLGSGYVIGIKGKDRACLVTLFDRKNRFLIVDKASAKNATPVGNVIINGLKEHPYYSITLIEGKNLLHIPLFPPRLTRSTLPHHPWQQGTNEKSNRLLREYFQKEFDLTDLSDEIHTRQSG